MTTIDFKRKLGALFAEARKSNIKVVVASDEEGNNFNLIGTSTVISFNDTQENVVALCVDGPEDEDNIFIPYLY